MSLLTKGRITRLSELTIDTNKDWSLKEISKVKLPDTFVGLAKITVGTTPDPSPSVGDLWVDIS